MVLIYVDRGLGNQMFQYAYGVVLAQKVGKENIRYDLSYLDSCIEGRRTWDINSIFKGGFRRATAWEIFKTTGNLTMICKFTNRYHKRRPVLEPLFKSCHLVAEPEKRYLVNDECIQRILDKKFNREENYYIKGFWEDVKYFEQYKPLIYKHFTFKSTVIKDLKRKYKDIFQKQSISIHIRRGDYLKQRKSFGVCGKKYYEQAMQIIEEKVSSTLYIFFSDDPAYVYQAYRHIENKIVITDNYDYVDLYLMSCCKHNILANSTFSFWGGFLNKNPDKIVVAPKIHYVSYGEMGGKKIKFPFEETWIRIENCE